MNNLNVRRKEQELNRLKQKEQREKNKRRKERTHRLITKGALLEKYFDIKELDIDDTESLLKKLQPLVSEHIKQNKRE